MSKIGKLPIKIPDGVTVDIKDGVLDVKGKNGDISIKILAGIKVEIKDGELTFSLVSETKQNLSNWGTIRALVNNAIIGSVSDFTKNLILEGVGFKVVLDGSTLVLNLGFSHQVKFPIPEGIKIEVDKNNLKISGRDKATVGQVAATLRAMKKPEPYKGKGFRYSDEVVRRKAGKKATATATTK